MKSDPRRTGRDEMIGDWVEIMVDRRRFRAEGHARGKAEFEISANSPAASSP